LILTNDKMLTTKKLSAVNRVYLLSLMNPHVMLVEYEMYSHSFIFLFLDKNPGWVTDDSWYEDYPEDF
jgi:hypothetical protein